MSQLELQIQPEEYIHKISSHGGYKDTFLQLLRGNLDFHGQNSTYSAHAIHAFPAKFPPQLPRLFIKELTQPGEIVFDPMMGSGTTLLEAQLLGRHAIGSDIDPLALRIGWSKLSTVDILKTTEAGYRVVKLAQKTAHEKRRDLKEEIEKRFDLVTREFINYWFASKTQIELIALVLAIEQIDDYQLKAFFMLIFSSIIITKSGGVSLARDLAHTRPHRVNDKVPRPAIIEFSKRLKRILRDLSANFCSNTEFVLCEGDSQLLPLRTDSIDLIVTSPPYASNAIDYMRAHKFSLVWLGYPINSLGQLRRNYVGGEALSDFVFTSLPDYPLRIVNQLRQIDKKKSRVLHRYYSEMTKALTEMHRALKPGKAAVVVVGSSMMRDINTQTHFCLGEIGKAIGFELVHIGIRRLDRDKRMMPARSNARVNSQIESRMHEEYVIGFIKPLVGEFNGKNGKTAP